jgi:membrane protein YqaA with SNARE-associated domain
MSRLPTWLHALVAHGPAGYFVAAFLDASFLSLFEVTDFLIVHLATVDPKGVWWGVTSLTTGSLCGSTILWWLGRRGGEALLVKRIGGKRVEATRAAFEKWDVWALAFAAFLPPPAPFKVFVVAAGVFGCPFRRFAITLTVSRALRFAAWAALGTFYGPGALRLLKGSQAWMSGHREILVFALSCVCVAALLWHLQRVQKARRSGARP